MDNLASVVLDMDVPLSFRTEEPWQGSHPQGHLALVSFPLGNYRGAEYDFDADMKTTRQRWNVEIRRWEETPPTR